ncbi:MAG: multicopper oxidase domain-containing protein, partial [Nitrososphaeraceae archaeon]
MNKFTTSFIIGLFATILLTSTITASQIPVMNLQKNTEYSIDGLHPVIKTVDALEDNNVNIKADINKTQEVNGTIQENDIKANINETQEVNTLSSYDPDNSYGKDKTYYEEKPRKPKTHEVVLEVVPVSAEGGAIPTGHIAYKMNKHIAYDGESCKEDFYKYCEDLTYRYSDIGTIPGPTIEMYEGDTLILETHIPSMDGFNDYDVKKQILKPKKPGTFEYFGEKNKEIGLFGAIIVHPTYDKKDMYGINALIDGEIQQVDINDIKKQYVLYMVGSTFWGMEIDENHIQKPLWINPTLGADLGDLVQFHILGAAHDHTFHLHAHRWLDPGTGNVIDTKTILPGTTHSFIVQAGNFVGPGNWQYHCHVFAHMEAGMMGNFVVGDQGDNTQRIAGASPYDTASISTITGSNFVTFQITDEPGIWFNNIANLNRIVPELGGSLGILNPNGTAHFIMTDTNTVHTVTSLLWPTGSKNMPFDQMTGNDGGASVQLDKPGLHVFTCKIHPYMFAGIIVDDPNTFTTTTNGENVPAYDIGDKLTLVNGIELDTTPSNTTGSTFPIFTSLVKTFFKVTNFGNWKDYRANPTDVLSLPPVMVKLGGDNIVSLDILNNTGTNDRLFNPQVPGIGEVWVNTQFEITEGKSKPGTATKVNTSTWEVEQKVSLPEINMNHPHNMWTDSDQKIIYQTMWFDDRLAVFD